MSYPLSKNDVIYRPSADADCAILIVDGEVIVFAEDPDERYAGYYQSLREGQYVFNPHEGYSCYLHDGVLQCQHEQPPHGFSRLDVDDGCQELVEYGDEIAKMLGIKPPPEPEVIVTLDLEDPEGSYEEATGACKWRKGCVTIAINGDESYFNAGGGWIHPKITSHQRSNSGSLKYQFEDGAFEEYALNEAGDVGGVAKQLKISLDDAIDLIQRLSRKAHESGAATASEVLSTSAANS